MKGNIYVYLNLLFTAAGSQGQNATLLRGVQGSSSLSHCKKYGDNFFLAPVITPEDKKRLINTVKHMNINGSVWLPLSRLNLQSPEWTDGTLFVGEAGKWPADMSCGLLHLRDTTYELDVCNEPIRGYLCQLPDGNTCQHLDTKVPPADCISVSGSSYVYRCDRTGNSWYQARNKCLHLGLDLARPKTHAAWEAMGAAWYEKKKKSCRRVWIGLRKEKWLLEDPVALKWIEPTLTSWDANQPNPHGDCAVTSYVSSFDIKWKSIPCDDFKSALCLKYFANVLPSRFSTDVALRPSENPKYSEASLQSPPSGFTGGIVAGCIILLVAAVAGILFFRYRTKLLSQCRREDIQQTTVPESISLLVPAVGNKETSTVEYDDIAYFSYPTNINMCTYGVEFDCTVNADGGVSYDLPTSGFHLEVAGRKDKSENESTIKAYLHTKFYGYEYLLPSGESIITPAIVINFPIPNIAEVKAVLPHDSPDSVLGRNIHIYGKGFPNGKLYTIWEGSTNHSEAIKLEKNNIQIILNDITKESGKQEIFCTRSFEWPRKLSLNAFVYANLVEQQGSRHGSELEVKVFVLESVYAEIIEFNRSVKWGHGKLVTEVGYLTFEDKVSDDDMFCIKLEVDDWVDIDSDTMPVHEVRMIKDLRYKHHGCLVAHFTLVTNTDSLSRVMLEITFGMHQNADTETCTPIRPRIETNVTLDSLRENQS